MTLFVYRQYYVVSPISHYVHRVPEIENVSILYITLQGKVATLIR